MDYKIFLELAIIVVGAKLGGLVARKCKAPMVVGEIIAGLILGPSVLGWVQIESGDLLSGMAEIGVIILMFSAGLSTNLKELKKTGGVAFLIACMGVLVPLIGGTLLHMAIYGVNPIGSVGFLKSVFIGVIITATSVSITVEALKEMGKLKTSVGTTIVSAAIIDDVLGIMVLTFVVGMKDADTQPVLVVGKTLLFLVFAVVVGFAVYWVFKKIDAKYPHTRRIPIAGLALCFLMAYVSEEWFGVADITGAYVAGVILCSIQDSDYIADKMDIESYMLFGPIFFASIGLKTTLTLNMQLLWFTIGFVVVALVCKIVGCGLAAKVCKFSWSNSLKCGIGMMTRGEVALIVAQKGLSIGLMDEQFFACVIMLIIVSSVLTPILLKVIYNQDAKKGIADV